MNNVSRTDLAAELIKAKGRDFDGVCKVSVVDLDSARAAAYGKSEGRYVTLETDAITGYSPRDKTRLARVLAGQLAALLPSGVRSAEKASVLPSRSESASSR